MKKTVSNIITSLLILTLLILPVLALMISCCCLDEASASTTEQVEHCHSHSDKTDHQNKTHDAHECMCQNAANADVEKSFELPLIPSHFYKEFFKNEITMGRFFNEVLFNYALLLADISPPLLATVSIPIYLKISVLRI